MNEQKARALLQSAADSLQWYCSEVNGDMNDSLADEIERFLRDTLDGKENQS